jgi:hypothetical protein
MDPATVDLRSAGKPDDDIAITITISGGATCSGLMAQLEIPGAGSRDRSLGTGLGPHVWSIGKNEISGWTTGTGTIRVLRGASVIGSKSFTVN